MPWFFGSSTYSRGTPYPYEPARPDNFRAWTHPSQSNIVHTLSRGASSRHYILRKELPPSMISEGYLFGPHHLIMAALLYFEEKLHRKKLLRADAIPLLFPRLLCQILEHLRYPAEPQHERRRICREIFTLDKWTSMTAYGATYPCSGPTEHIPEVAPSAPQATPQPPHIIPPTSEPSPSAEPRIDIPIIEYRGLCHTFQALATSQSILTQQMTALRPSFGQSAYAPEEPTIGEAEAVEPPSPQHPPPTI
ncbi:hypothetical protein CK203_109687 [Vitis vinifera]|uniref:Uncharacterized protein n=1 Tax=Vitis vinifera TaxID=29760 RepID=A0A438BSV9_VITVI|nr:hypothetical protein CK203_109687 [Vitis vinifera]